jgi:hypothetical protein
MSVADFTPEPWTAAEPEVEGGLPRVLGPEHVDVYGASRNVVADGVSTVPNAHLIAAAPALYAAARPLVDLIARTETSASLRSGSFIGDQYRVKEVTAGQLRRLRDALAAAEGR